MTVRFSPSLVSYERDFSRPVAITRVPRWRDSAMFSAASRQIEQRMKRVSPSFHSLDCRSNVRGVDATVKLATAAPEGVNRSSGSSVRLPTTVMMVSPAMRSPCSPVRVLSGHVPPSGTHRCREHRRWEVAIHRYVVRRARGTGLLVVGPDDL